MTYTHRPVPLPELPRWFAQPINRMSLPMLGVVDNHYVSKEFVYLDSLDVVDDQIQAPADLEFRILDCFHYGPNLKWLPWAALVPKPWDLKVLCVDVGLRDSPPPAVFRIDRERIFLTRRNKVSANAALAAKGLPRWDFVVRWRHIAAARFVVWWSDDVGGVL